MIGRSLILVLCGAIGVAGRADALTWQPTGSMASSNVRALAVARDGTVYAGTSSGVFRSSDQGGSWQAVNGGLTSLGMRSLAIDSTTGNLYVGTGFGGGVFRSLDGGDSWQNVFPSHGALSLALGRDGTKFAGTQSSGVFRSTGDDFVWAPVDSGLANAFDKNALAFHASGVLFLGARGLGDLFRLLPGANGWTRAATGLPSSSVHSLLFLPPMHLFAGLGDRSGVYVSTNAGANWSPVNHGLTEGLIQDLVVQALAANHRGEVFAGTRLLGVFLTINRGGDWIRVSDGLTTQNVQALAVAPDGYLYAGTNGGGVFRTVESTTGAAPVAATGAATEVESTTLTLNGTVQPNGLTTSVLFEYGTTASYGTEVPAITTPVTGSRSLEVAAHLAGLAPNTRYHYRVIAQNTVGTAEGADSVVTTMLAPNRPPVVAHAIPDTTLIVSGDSWSLDLESDPSRFSDPDGEVLTYTVTSTTPAVAIVSLVETVLTVIPMADGQTVIQVRARDPRGGSDSTTCDVTVLANQPPVVLHVPVGPIDEQRSVLIRATLSDDTGIQEAAVYYRRGGDSLFVHEQMTAGPDGFEASLPPAWGDEVVGENDARGIEYFLRVEDRGRLVRLAPPSGVYSIQVRLGGEGARKGVPLTGGSEQTAYRLVSFPLELVDSTVTNVLADDLEAYDATKWRLFGMDARGDLVEPPSLVRVEPGQAYWLIVRKAGEYLDTGPGTTIPSSGPHRHPLRQGWNLVGNPFAFDVPADHVTIRGVPANLREYLGAWNHSPVLELRAFGGCALRADVGDTLVIDPDRSRAAPAPIRAAPLWRVEVHAQCGEARDVDNVAAVIPGASPGVDGFDDHEPPPIGGFVSVAFTPETEDGPPRSLSLDARPESSAGYVWNIQVRTNLHDEVRLTFAGLETLPTGLEVRIVDENGFSFDPRTRRTYTVIAPIGGRRLELRAGTPGSVHSAAGAPVWQGPALRVAPTPLVEASSISYELPNDDEVSMDVIDVLGRKIRTLVRNEVRVAGAHIESWNASTDDGMRCPAGLYWVRLRTGSVVTSCRVVVAR